MTRPRKQNSLLPQRHKEPDFFVCDILDATPKGDRASMEHPLFSLSVKKDMAPFKYEHDGTGAEMTISPSKEGRANMFDRDILIYVLSQLMAAKNDGKKLGRRIRFCAHDLLKSTNRFTTGPAYKTLRTALTRLQFTQIETNIHDHGVDIWRSISFITDVIIYKEDATGRMLDVEIEIGAWLLRAVENNNVLTLDRAYFQLRKPLERRLYELARKHCGHQKEWKIGLDKLQHKTGSTSWPKEFKRLVKGICTMDAEEHHMPDYDFRLVDNCLIVTPKQSFSDRHKDPDRLGFSGMLSPETYAGARRVCPGWDIHGIEGEWRNWCSKEGISPHNPDAHFLKFCESWYEKRGAPH